ncbi:apoptosis-related protein, putative [Plasmodium vinckei petteri]|uniref:Apoptosis-related protein, putative n=7 Tax=Plasmodium (Vinckeia) TaxID=418101 RepID=A0A6V7T3I6_PLAVN|nr:apoptosis-related protein, putative [Plasmodium vinckei petteri]
MSLYPNIHFFGNKLIMNIEKAEVNSKLLELSRQNIDNKAKKDLELKQKQEELLEQKRIILKSLLTPDAHARLSRIAIVKEENARRIEDIIIRNSQMGLLHKKIDEDQLIKLIEQVSGRMNKKEPVVEIRRRKQFDDDDDFNEEDYM